MNIPISTSPALSSSGVRGLLVPLVSLCLCSFASARNEYRNVALNPDDVHESEWTEADGYPHATSNSEYPDFDDKHLGWFQARCAIDGRVDNKGHGSSRPSWGPNNVENYMEDLYWRVDLGEPMEVDKVVIYIRADFPHDDYWHSGTLRFSDGSSEAISLEKTAEPQEFPFSSRTTEYLIITDLVEELPREWCALTEVELWGRELPTSTIRSERSICADDFSHAPVTRLPSIVKRNGFPVTLLNGRIISAKTSVRNPAHMSIRCCWNNGEKGIIILRRDR